MENTLVEIKQEVGKELANPDTLKTLVATTFKGLNPTLIPQAMVEGMIRGFKFKDFLEKNIYAIPFKNKQTGVESYSLVTSVDYTRKLGMRNGVVGISEPKYEEKDGKIISCTVTVKRKVDDYIGDYSATVYFLEYSTGYNLWASKPRTMIAKVAEVHALRKACPEQLSQTYTEEEVEKEALLAPKEEFNTEPYKALLENAPNLLELGKVWSALPVEAKEKLEKVKDELKKKFNESPKV